ncbi:unnamed protein product [Lymnaea stagnalis]|uniref:Protein shisa-5 n=1 Tax=Lymnaea stagnalis TaxID=6523 RepID=A0AAV2HCM2_LYMST
MPKPTVTRNLKGKEVCVLRYTPSHGSEIKNITFRCEHGCCGTESKEYCCLSAPTLLGAIFTAALFGILCVVAISDYLYKKCQKHSTSRTAVQIIAPVSTIAQPIKKQTYMTTVCNSVPLAHYVEAQHYPYYGPACYTYPLMQPYHGAPFAPRLPAFPNSGGPDTSNPVAFASRKTFDARTFTYTSLGMPDASEPPPYTYTDGSHTPKLPAYTTMASPVSEPSVCPLVEEPKPPNRHSYSAVRIPSAPPLAACDLPKES